MWLTSNSQNLKYFKYIVLNFVLISKKNPKKVSKLEIFYNITFQACRSDLNEFILGSSFVFSKL